MSTNLCERHCELWRSGRYDRDQSGAGGRSRRRLFLEPAAGPAGGHAPLQTQRHARPDAVGAAFALTNAPFNNEVVAFSRASSGALTQSGIFSTGGAGQGVDFDSDYGLTLSPDHKYLYAVSPASDMITVFGVEGSCLHQLQQIYAGDQPVGMTYDWDKKLLYALD